MPTPSPFDPFREIDRFFSRPSRSEGGAVPMDLYRQGDNYIIKVDLPGVDPSSVDVDVEERTVTIRAQREPVRGDDIQWLSRERTFGTFARQITVGDGLSLDKAAAEFNEGVLTLTIPVAEAAKPRKIQVQHTTGSTEGHDIIEGEG